MIRNGDKTEDNLLFLLDTANRLLADKKSVIIAIDGRCASGKTTLASRFSSAVDCNIFHMDDFFLPPEKRTKERLTTPGGNTDCERFLSEVLLPLKSGAHFSYRPYDCHNGSFKDQILVKPKPINLIEGSYSCHNSLRHLYDYTVFLTISESEQLSRIKKRNPLSLDMFTSKWIPLEELYFKEFGIADLCDAVLEG